MTPWSIWSGRRIHLRRLSFVASICRRFTRPSRRRLQRVSRTLVYVSVAHPAPVMDWWPVVLMPLYALCEIAPSTRATARRLGLVTIGQMVRALVNAVENPPVRGTIRVVEVPEIRRSVRL